MTKGLELEDCTDGYLARYWHEGETITPECWAACPISAARLAIYHAIAYFGGVIP